MQDISFERGNHYANVHSALNKLISCRDELFENFDSLKGTLFDTADLDKELVELQSEMTVVAELIQKFMGENAHTKVNQDDYRIPYEGLAKRFEAAKSRFSEVTAQRKDKEVRRETIEAFIAELRKHDGLVSEFDNRLWHTLIDYVTVYNKNDVRFTFKDGTEIQV